MAMGVDNDLNFASSLLKVMPPRGARNTNLASRNRQICHNSRVGIGSRCSSVTSPILLAMTFVAMSINDRGPLVPRGVNRGYGLRRDQSRSPPLMVRFCLGTVHSL